VKRLGELHVPGVGEDTEEGELTGSRARGNITGERGGPRTRAKTRRCESRGRFILFSTMMTRKPR
jgi:hypothetical protein